MNKTKKKSIIILLVVLLIGTLFASHMMTNAVATGEPTVIVSNYTEFEQAIKQATHGDVIGYDGNINIDASVTIGENEKHIILKKINEEAHFNISGGTVIVQNLTFDGDSISTSYPLIITSANTIYKNVIFQNGNAIWSNGGAVSVRGGVTNFINCTFKNNIGSQGGHIYASAYSKVTVENSLFENGYASDGGAIKNHSYTQYGFTIRNSTITGNSAATFGGGISNNGYLEIYETKIFNNTASNGGADIANASSLLFPDSVEELMELFKNDGIVPKGWVNDYDFETGVNVPGIDPTQPNSLLKLDYEILPTEIILEDESLGTASDSKVTGLESGKHYKVASNDFVSYSKADGTLTEIESEASPLIGTEIIGLINGETYLIEEFTPTPTTVLLDSLSLGTADDEKIINLEVDKYYMVTVDDEIYYSKADGSLTTDETEAEQLTGTEIVGLTNGLIYLVEEYIPLVEEDPIDEEDENDDPEIPDEDNEPTDLDEQDPTDPTDPGTETPGDEEPKDPVDKEDPDKDDEPNTPITSTTNNVTNTTNNTNNTTDKSTTHHSNSKDDSSTVKNYSYDHSTHSITENTYIPSANNGNGEKGGQASANQHQTITVDYGDIADGIKVQEDGRNITINVNVNVDTNKTDEAESLAVEVASEQPSSISNISWIDLVKICFLFGIFICVFKRPIAK